MSLASEAISGPPRDAGTPAFTWSGELGQDTPHRGQPDAYDTQTWEVMEP